MTTAHYGSANLTTAHASNPRVFDALYFSTTSGAASCTVVMPQGSGSVSLSGIVSGSIIPIRTRLITALGGTGVVCIGLGDTCEAMYYNSGQAVTPSDTAQNIFDAFYISAGTRLDVTPAGSSGVVTFTVVPGSILPVRSRLVMVATTATVIGLKF